MMDINAHKENHFHVSLNNIKDTLLIVFLCIYEICWSPCVAVLIFIVGMVKLDSNFKTTNEDNIHQCYSQMYDTQKKMEKCKTKTECEKYKFILSQYQCEKLTDTFREKN